MVDAKQKSLGRFWLLLGVAGLAVGGVLALPLAVAHTPAFASPAMQRLFHNALVVHVDLTVLAWFLSIACMFWSVEARNTGSVEKAALASFALGMVFIAASPLDRHGQALMSNYIPVIFSPVFFLGLALLGTGVGLQILHFYYRIRQRGEAKGNAQTLTCLAAGGITLMALVAFCTTPGGIPQVIEGAQYYDILFWAGGHILQNTHGLFAMLCWLLLATALRPGLKSAASTPLYYGLLISGAAAIAGFIYSFYAGDASAFAYREFFTRYVMELGGIGPALAGLWVLTKISLPSAKERALFSALVMSLLLFFYGGILGFMIHGQNVTIPAHYHGSIVGITLAFMGLAYLWLPKFGYAEVAGTRLAFWQPIMYGVGQALHVTGLAWSGGYGVLRKTPGALEGHFSAAKAAMGLMGIGGLLAIIGGFLFVIVVARAVMRGGGKSQA